MLFVFSSVVSFCGFDKTLEEFEESSVADERPYNAFVMLEVRFVSQLREADGTCVL